MNLINKVISQININEIAQTNYDVQVLRCCALQTIKNWIDTDGLYQFAKNHNVLVDGSAEDFAIQFYKTFNDEVFYVY
jgi:hypothetical protein